MTKIISTLLIAARAIKARMAINALFFMNINISFCMDKYQEENTLKKEFINQTKQLITAINTCLTPELIQIIENNLIDENQFLLIKLFGSFIAFNGHARSINSVVFSYNNKFALTGAYDNKALLWDLSDVNNIYYIF